MRIMRRTTGSSNLPCNSDPACPRLPRQAVDLLALGAQAAVGVERARAAAHRQP